MYFLHKYEHIWWVTKIIHKRHKKGCLCHSGFFKDKYSVFAFPIPTVVFSGLIFFKSCTIICCSFSFCILSFLALNFWTSSLVVIGFLIRYLLKSSSNADSLWMLKETSLASYMRWVLYTLHTCSKRTEPSIFRIKSKPLITTIWFFQGFIFTHGPMYPINLVTIFKEIKSATIQVKEAKTV